MALLDADLWWADPATGLLRRRGWPSRSGAAVNHDWTDSNPPWAYTDTSVFTAGWPTGTKLVDLKTGSADFYTNLMATVDAAGQRCVVVLPDEVLHLTRFNLIGSSGDPNYSFGFWHPNLQGFLGQGADKTVIQLDANSMTTAQLNALKTLAYGPTGKPNMMHFGRLDGANAASPVLLAGVCFRGADQQNLDAVDPSLSGVVTVPQPAPYAGVQMYQGAYGKVSYCRFQAPAHAWSSQPPFEHWCVDTQYANVTYSNCEIDGRRAAEVDAARPRRCGPYGGNNEGTSTLTDCWLHDSNVSRYAVNDQNRDTQGVYSLIRTKIEQITNTKNDGHGGYTNAALCGWESSNATINVQDCIMSVDNPYNEGGNQGLSNHLQFTTVTRNPRGGRLYVSGNNIWRNTGFPGIDGYLTVRVAPASSIYWKLDGYDTTMNVQNAAGTRLQPYVHTGTWPPSAAALQAAGIYPESHFIVREN